MNPVPQVYRCYHCNYIVVLGVFKYSRPAAESPYLDAYFKAPRVPSSVAVSERKSVHVLTSSYIVYKIHDHAHLKVGLKVIIVAHAELHHHAVFIVDLYSYNIIYIAKVKRECSQSLKYTVWQVLYECTTYHYVPNIEVKFVLKAGTDFNIPNFAFPCLVTL